MPEHEADLSFAELDGEIRRDTANRWSQQVAIGGGNRSLDQAAQVARKKQSTQ
jgi:hypothetical protein